MITITGEEDIVTKAVAHVQQIQKEMADITTQEIKIDVRGQLETKCVDPKTELSVDASTNPANDSEKRMLLGKEATETEGTHMGLYETKRRRRRKYTTQESNVFEEKDIKMEILSHDIPRSSIQNKLPYIGVSDSGHAEDRFPTRLLSTPNKDAGELSKKETDLMMMEIGSTEPDIKTRRCHLPGPAWCPRRGPCCSPRGSPPQWCTQCHAQRARGGWAQFQPRPGAGGQEGAGCQPDGRHEGPPAEQDQEVVGGDEWSRDNRKPEHRDGVRSEGARNQAQS
jgi:hypothetical protein